MKLIEILNILEKHGLNEYNCPYFNDDGIMAIAIEIKESINKTDLNMKI